MSNPIDRLPDTAVHRLSEPGGKQRPAGADERPDESVRSSDLLDLTGRARELKALETDLASSAPFDAERVAELRQALADGSYKVNAERIAEKLLDLEHRLP